mmetsp:Transcript_77477/g.250718  ORF Transcript_77477/g.250718 Transcript_77477/m.250718 type:complete len:235 (+) Transcript_77477:152-856(+)
MGTGCSIYRERASPEHGACALSRHPEPLASSSILGEELLQTSGIVPAGVLDAAQVVVAELPPSFLARLVGLLQGLDSGHKLHDLGVTPTHATHDGGPLGRGRGPNSHPLVAHHLHRSAPHVVQSEAADVLDEARDEVAVVTRGVKLAGAVDRAISLPCGLPRLRCSLPGLDEIPHAVASAAAAAATHADHHAHVTAHGVAPTGAHAATAATAAAAGRGAARGAYAGTREALRRN